MKPIVRLRRPWQAAVALVASLFAAAGSPPTVNTVPLCPGLSVVTAISQSNGDYESIKTIESISDKAVALKYSSEATMQDPLSSQPAHLVKTTLQRTILLADLKSASLYEQQFYDRMPTEVPGTTAIGTSAGIIQALRSKGEADIGIFLELSGDVSLDRDSHPNIFDFQLLGHVKRVEPKDVYLPLLVNDQLVQLPAIHVEGDFRSRIGA